jgi:hypothetical protein
MLLLVAIIGSTAAESTVGANFSAVFGDGVVLQRAPSKAQVFGFAGNTWSFPATVTVNVTIANANEDLVSKAYSAPVRTDGTWKVVLDAQPAGGDVTLSVACTKGCTNTESATIKDATYGVSEHTLPVFTAPYLLTSTLFSRMSGTAAVKVTLVLFYR